MPVFISHTSVDKPAAYEIYSFLRAREIACYIDMLDPELQSADDITSVIILRIEQCTHMMAVVSQYTQGSWWVPFEIGVASRADRRITTYRLRYVDLPSFLSKWPILKARDDLEKFVRKYKDDSLVPIQEGRAYAATIKTADQFHKELKRSLGQL